MLTAGAESSIRKSTFMSQSVTSELTREEKLDLFQKLGRVSTEDDGRIIKDENEEVINVDLASYVKLVMF